MVGFASGNYGRGGTIGGRGDEGNGEPGFKRELRLRGIRGMVPQRGRGAKGSKSPGAFGMPPSQRVGRDLRPRERAKVVKRLSVGG